MNKNIINNYMVNIVNNTPSSILGEGAIWHPTENVLYWIDITGKKIYQFNPKTEETKTLIIDSMPGTVVPTKGIYTLLVAQETGIYGISHFKKLTKLANFPDENNNNRFNDGKCDPNGRFWVGTINKNGEKNISNLYFFNGKNLIKKKTGITNSNGIVWDLSSKIMYHIDTPKQSVFSYNFDINTGNISNKKTAITIPSELGAPDGMTIDSEGMLWVAHWGGKAVIRWNPNNGEILQKIDIPAPNVTSCAFGGKDLNTLFITTAKEGLSKKQLNKYPLSGRLFKTKLNIKGTYQSLYIDSQ